MGRPDTISRRSFLCKVRILAVFAFIISLFVADIALAAEQQVLFCVESIRYENHTGQSRCESECNKKHIDCGLDSLLSEGWLIVSSSPKETIAVNWTSVSGWAPLIGQNVVNYYGCSCVGTQYVLRKEDKSTTANSKTSGKEADLLKKENELLKRENEILKRENEKLKSKLKAKQK